MQTIEKSAEGSHQKSGVDQEFEWLRQAFRCETNDFWMEKMGVRPETVRTWRNRGFVPTKQLMKAAKLTKRAVGPYTLIYDSANPGWGSWGEAAAESAEPTETKALVSHTQGAGKTRNEVKVQLDVQQYFLVPQLSVHASAGNGYAVDTEDVIGRFAFRRDWLSKKVISADAARVITAKGRSMEPTVRDGDILLVDTSPQERLTDGIYVLDVEGESKCKRLQRLVDGGLRIHSDNAAEFPPEDVPPGRVEQVRVVGKVIWVGGER